MSCHFPGSQIIAGEGNKVFHLEWDNMNKVRTNIYSSNVVNSTGGIMIHEAKRGLDVSNKAPTFRYYCRTDQCRRNTLFAPFGEKPKDVIPKHNC